MSNMKPRTFRQWCGSSLFGHICLIQLICATPLSLMFITIMASEGTLSFGWALLVYFLCSVLFAIGAVLFWHMYSKPVLRERGR